MERQELDQSKHAPEIASGGSRKEFPKIPVGVQVTIARRLAPTVPAIEKKGENPQVAIPRGPKEGKKRQLEVKNPENRGSGKQLGQEKKKET